MQTYIMTLDLKASLHEAVDGELWDSGYIKEMHDAIDAVEDGGEIPEPTSDEIERAEMLDTTPDGLDNRDELEASYPVFSLVEYFGLQAQA